MRFHVLAIPHTVSTPEYSTCAFTQKVVKLCRMLKLRGHHVIHYGHEDSKVECDENVVVMTARDMELSYGKHNWRKNGFPDFKITDAIYGVFFARTIAEIAKRKQAEDFLLCPFGLGHKAVADAHPDLIACESGIGYPDGTFTQFRIFESYAVLHAYLGQGSIKTPTNNHWYDAVIPNSFDLSEFKFSNRKNGCLLFLGRVNGGKGVYIAAQIATATKTHLLIAGQGTPGKRSQFVRYIGPVGPNKRKQLLASAKAVLCPSTFLEPFCGVQIEAMLSGTPVISSDFGAFAEYNVHGVTGYRCKTFEQFTWAVNNIANIDPKDCRAWAERFSLDRISYMYDEYFKSVKDIFGGEGWYAKHDDRANLRNTSFPCY